MNARVTALATVAVFALAGCSSTTPTSTGTTATPSTTTMPSPTSTAPTTSAAAAPTTTALDVNAPVALGRWFTFPDVKTRVIQVRKSVSSPNSDSPASKRWFAALVQSCVAIPKGTSFSWGPWSVSDADGAQYEASSSTWEDFPRPVYPFANEAIFAKGECAKGWIMFSVLKGTKVSLIRYSNEQGNLGRWKL